MSLNASIAKSASVIQTMSLTMGPGLECAWGWRATASPTLPTDQPTLGMTPSKPLTPLQVCLICLPTVMTYLGLHIDVGVKKPSLCFACAWISRCREMRECVCMRVYACGTDDDEGKSESACVRVLTYCICVSAVSRWTPKPKTSDLNLSLVWTLY